MEEEYSYFGVAQGTDLGNPGILPTLHGENEISSNQSIEVID